MATRNLLVKIGADTTDVTRKLRGLTRPFNSLSAAAQQTGRTLTIGLTAPLTLIGGLALKMSADFESGMNRVRAVTGATGKTFERLEDVAKNLGATTRFSATEAADAMGFLGQAGFDANKIMTALPATLNLAAAGALELGQSADLVTDVLAGFGLEADQATRLTNILAKAAASSNTSVEQMGEAFSFVGPVAKAMSVSLEDASAAITFLSDAGVKGARAGTALRSVLGSLAKPTTAAAVALKKAGIGADDFKTGVITLPEILKKLAAANLDAGDKIAIFNKKMFSAGEILISSAPKFDAVSESFSNLNDDAARMAATMDEGAKGGLRALKSALEALAIAVTSNGILDGFSAIVRSVADMVRGLAKASPALLNFVVILAGVAATIGPLLLAFGLLKPAIIAVGTLLAGISGPVGLAIGAFVLLGSGIAAVALAKDDLDESLENTGSIGTLRREVLDLEKVIARFGVTVKQQANEGLQEYRDRLEEVRAKVLETRNALDESNRSFINIATSLKLGFEATEKYISDLELFNIAAGKTDTVLIKAKKSLDAATSAVKSFGQKVAEQIKSLRDQVVASKIAATAQQEYAVQLANSGQIIKDTEPARFKLVDSLKRIATEQDKATKAAAKSVEPLRNSGAAFETMAAAALAGVQPVIDLVSEFDKLPPSINAAALESLKLEGAYKALGVTSSELADQQLARLRAQLEIINQAYREGRASLEDLRNAQEAYANAADRSGESTKNLSKDMQAVSLILDRLFQDLADFVLGMKSFADTLKSIGQAIVQTMVKETFKAMRDEILENDKALKKLIETFKKFLGLGKKTSDTVTKGAGDVITGGGGKVGGGVPTGGALPIVDVITGIVTAISSVISNFQLARLEGSLNKIELNTRQTTRALTGAPELLAQSAQAIGQAAGQISDATKRNQIVIPSQTVPGFEPFPGPTGNGGIPTPPPPAPPGLPPPGPEGAGAGVPGPQQGLGVLQVLFQHSDFLQDSLGQLKFQTASLDTLKEQATRREGLLELIRDSLTGLKNVGIGGAGVPALLGQIKEGISGPNGVVARMNARILQAQKKFDFDRDIMVPIQERQALTLVGILSQLINMARDNTFTPEFPRPPEPIGGALL